MPTVPTNGIETYYESFGAGPPVVFAHGATSDHRIWADRAAPLADDYEVIVYDARGHGKTGPSDVADYSMSLFAEDLQAFLDALDLENPVVVGLSMGGWLAQAHAAAYPDRTAGLVTLGAMTPEVLTRREWVERRLIPGSILVADRLGQRERAFALVERLWAYLDDEGSQGDIEEAERIQRDHPTEVPEPEPAEQEKIMDANLRYPRGSIDHERIAVPTLAMYAEREPDSVARHARYMADVIPEGEAREIPDAGHNAHVDNPDFIREALREFLADLPDHR